MENSKNTQNHIIVFQHEQKFIIKSKQAFLTMP